MIKIPKVKFISIWIFLIPFIAVNTCLLLILEYQWIFPDPEDLIHNHFPYFDGGASISRVVRPYPNWLIFKPAMFLTAFFLIKYWLYNKEIIQHFKKDHKYIKKFVFFGVCSAIALVIHSIFLGIKFEYDLYKLFRRVIMLSFIIFEVAAQTYLVLTFISLKDKLSKHIYKKYLNLKIILVSILIIVAIICIPIITLPGNKFLKHALEWDYFLGVILFYLLTFLMWKKK